MKVKEAMKQVYVIDEDVKLHKVAEMMSANNVGTVVFMNGEEIGGIITEEDLVRNFHKDKRVTDAMTKNVITIDGEEGIDAALELMNEHGIKKLPVLDEGKLSGIISLTEIAANASELENDFFFGD